jgi:hypothetical protein
MLVAHVSLFRNALTASIFPHDHRDRFFASETATPSAAMGPMNEQSCRFADLSEKGGYESRPWSSKIHTRVRRSRVLDEPTAKGA